MVLRGIFSEGLISKLQCQIEVFFKLSDSGLPKIIEKTSILYFAVPSLDRWNCSKEFQSFLKTKSKFVNVRNCCQDSLCLDATHLIQLVPLYQNKSSMLVLLFREAFAVKTREELDGRHSALYKDFYEKAAD